MLPSFEVFLQLVGNIFEWVLQQGQALAYAFGLLTVGCLALRRKPRGIAISSLLGLLWAWMGIGFLREDPTWVNHKIWLGLAILVQSGLFFWFGAIRSRLWFEPRADARPILGALLLAFGLGVFPFMRHPSVEEPSVLFPGLLLTLGLLLFARPPVSWAILAIPLLLAAVGGGERSTASTWIGWAPLAGFLGGLTLLLPTREKRQEGDKNYRTETIQEYAYRYQGALGGLLWALALIILLFAFVATMVEEPWKAPLRQLAISSLAVASLGLILWLALPAWFSVSFRYLAWSVTRGIRALYEAGISRLLPYWGRLAALAVLALALSNADYLDNQGNLLSLILGVLAAAFVAAGYRARRCIVVQQFGTPKECAPLEPLGKELAFRLRNELVNIVSLYRTIDEALPEKRGKIFASSLGVENVAESVTETVGPESAKVGTMEIPFGLLLRILGRLVRGPRLTASLQKQNSRLVLIAELSGGDLEPRSWKIHSVEPEVGVQPADEVAVAYLLVEQLAYRVIAYIGSVGSKRWEAVQHFTEGLRIYRSAQLSSGDCKPVLRKAEREFIQALNEDEAFVQCHFNLGVIYMRMEEPDSAAAAFRRCLSEQPNRSAAYYSLAEVYFYRGDYLRASIYAARALEISPLDPYAWNLMAVAEDADEYEEYNRAGKARDSVGPHILIASEIAAACAWISLCGKALARFSSPLEEDEVEVPAQCLANLGSFHKESHRWDASERIFRQALSLVPQGAPLHLLLGQLLAESGERDALRAASEQLYRAFGEALDSAQNEKRWISLLKVSSHLQEKTGRKDDLQMLTRAYRNFLDRIVPDEETILTSAESSKGRELAGRWVKSLLDLSRALAELPFSKEGASLQKLIELLGQLGTSGDFQSSFDSLNPAEQKWISAQQLIWNARLELQKDPEWAADCLKTAIEKLDEGGEREGHHRQVMDQSLHSLAAKAYLLQVTHPPEKEHGERAPRSELLEKALGHAQLSVVQNPESAARRWILANVYCVLCDYEQAQAEREAALRLGPDLEVLGGPGEIDGLAQDYERYARVPDSRLREERYREARELFRRLLSLVESDSLGEDAKLWADRVQIHARMHFHLGCFHALLREWTEAIHHLRIAKGMGCEQIDAALRLGNLYMEIGFQGEAEEAFQEVLAGEPGLLSAEQAAKASLGLADLLTKHTVRLDEAAHRLEEAARQISKIPRKRAQMREDLEAHCCAIEGRLFLLRGDFPTAIEKLRRTAEMRPSAEAYLCLSSAYREGLSHGAIPDPVHAREDAKKAEEWARRLTPSLLPPPGSPEPPRGAWQAGGVPAHN